MESTSNITIRLHWSGLFKAYRRLSSHETIFQSFWVTILLVVAVILSAIFCDINTYKLLKKIAELAVSIFPSLTGLAFAGYTIVIGTISPNILRRLSKRPEDNKFNSLLEDCNAVFTFMLFIAIITLFMSFIVLVFLGCDWHTNNIIIVNSVNISVIFVLIYLICATFRSMLSVLINVFNFGQFIEYDSNKLKKENKPLSNINQIGIIINNNKSNKE